MKRLAICLTATVLLATACMEDTLLHCYKPISQEGWLQRDTVCFDVPEASQAMHGTLTIGLRTVANLPMQDIVLAIEQRLDSPQVVRCDTLRYPLTDAEGRALAPGINSHQYETQHIPFQLSAGQHGTIRIHHLMSRETMTGITEVGIRIDKE